MKIILGSSSPQRKMIMEEMGHDFKVISPDIDEKSIRDSDPRQLTLKVANAKADAVVKKADKNSLVIASDSIVLVNNILREKPEDKEQAYEWLKELSEGAPQTIVTSLVVVNTKTGERLQGIEEGAITFGPISDNEIWEFINSKQAFNHAGGFGVQKEPFLSHTKESIGEREALIGLPKKLTQDFLLRLGLNG